jgi:DNA-binding response OmpR family regulator
MADMNGDQVCEQIRSQEPTKTLPVLFISAQASLEGKLEGYTAAVDDSINKPIMFDELKQKIELAVK